MRASFLFIACLSPALGEPRTSANYTITTDTTDTGGARTTSAAYTNDGSAGGVTGISTVAAPAETAKSGYIAQLYDVTGLTLTAASLNVNEGATVQLGAWLALDDSTFLTVAPTGVTWSVQSGPVTGIDANGLATAGIVYADTAATVQGDSAGFTGLLGLTVIDSVADNFGTYAGDALPDGWQVQYFGENNPLAAPGIDADGDQHDNAFEYTAGLVPTDSESRFKLRIEAVPGQPTHRRVIFSPRLAGRTYTVKAKANLLTGTFDPLGSSTTSDAGDERTVTDLGATGATKVYHVEIVNP